LIINADALGLPRLPQPAVLEAAQLPIATPIAQELGLRDGQIVQASLRLTGGQPELILKGRIIHVPVLMLGHLAPTVWMKVVQTPQGGWALQPSAQPAVPAHQAITPLSAPMTPSLSQVASMPPAMLPAAYSRMANLLFRPPGPSDVTQLFRPGTLDALLKTLARPDLQAQWRSLQLSMAQLTPESLSNALAGALGAEVWLARGMRANAADPKLFLRRVAQAIQVPDKNANSALQRVESDDDADTVAPSPLGDQETPSRANGFTQLQHAIDEMESAQVQAIQAQAQREVLFRMTLPFVDAEPVELVFRREPRSSDQLPLLTVNVHSRSDIFGPVWLKTQLEGSEQIDLTMWAEKSDVAAAARQRSSELGNELQKAGLTMRSFKIVHGARPQAPADFVPTGRGLVVDMSA
jgi:hypothetical protein